MTDPRLLIVGPGAMGCAVGALLAQQGAAVALLDYKPERAQQIQRDGVCVLREGRETTVHLPCSADPAALGAADLLILLVKAYATREAASRALPCVGPQTAVLTLQNGLGNHEALAGVVPPRQVLAGAIVMGCASLAVGVVRVSGVGEITLGSPYGNPALAEEVAATLSRYWPQVRHEPRIENALWRKVIINAAINPLTAFHHVVNGQLLEDADRRAGLAAVTREATAVARACGADPFGEEDPVAVVEEVCRLTAANRSSMLQDVEAMRRTEVDQICGEIMRRGEAVRVEAPRCESLVGLVESLSGAVAGR